MRIIQWKNISTVIGDGEVQTIMNAIAKQVADHLPAYWDNEPVELQHFPKTVTMNAHEWQFIVADNSDQAGAAGYHLTTKAGEPIGYAFAKTVKDAGMQISVTISHEILEMIGDAYINQTTQWSNDTFLALELCDPCEDDIYGYEIDKVMVSDFVTPAYFVPESMERPFDMMGHLTAPNTLLKGGYQSKWQPLLGWRQIFANNVQTGRALIVTPHSRQTRRMVLQPLRLRSLE